MKHTRREKKRRADVARRFLKNNPPKMPESFTHKDWKRMARYAYSAFVCGYNTALNDVLKRDLV